MATSLSPNHPLTCLRCSWLLCPKRPTPKAFASPSYRHPFQRPPQMPPVKTPTSSVVHAIPRYVVKESSHSRTPCILIHITSQHLTCQQKEATPRNQHPAPARVLATIRAVYVYIEDPPNVRTHRHT